MFHTRKAAYGIPMPDSQLDVLTKKEWKDKTKLIEYISVAFGTFHLYYREESKVNS